MADRENNYQPPKRGRPPGRNRQAFNKEQKRARNAELERVRRGGIATATTDLSSEMQMKEKVKLAHLLAATLTHFIREREKEPVSEIQATNDALEAEIKELERQRAILLAATEEEECEGEEPSHSAEILNLEAATSSQFAIRDSFSCEENLLEQEASTSLQPAKRARFSSEENLLEQEATTSLQPAKRARLSSDENLLDQEATTSLQSAKRARLSSEQQSASEEELLLVLSPIAQSSPETEPEASPPYQPPAAGAGEMDSLLSPEQLRQLEALLDMVPDDEIPSWPQDCLNFLLQP
ncbi:unnamed protein product [Chilo suppressalis]|uniref:BZIP domain-containing protein n=1 Tax=Chilo suppressalis TaxID=168631 RepID=A0ABN8AWD8_CHISP|nr:unnamed protein product [Chilo suppressalis]